MNFLTICYPTIGLKDLSPIEQRETVRRMELARLAKDYLWET